ncbi:probable 28S ribosomal protein S6, mitochondrial [Venturia canescens]|uniref:probable 28S ribosomal protein S6, mitochondrial n=1 Tax=Venturia canescens TaxID=32260 RepID=UPI001C9C8CD8|nr:probable 28S ribosomal protein S6, mitochondrial [Venturia canescens]
MPTYEMPILFRVMTRPEVVSTLKRVASAIFNKGGFIRKIDNLGLQPTPYKTKAHGHIHREANYFILHFDVPPLSLEDINEEYLRDIDIIRARIYKKEEEPMPPCTLHTEILPPAYRPSVQKMVETARKQSRNKHAWNSHSGLHYYPFQR